MHLWFLENPARLAIEREAMATLAQNGVIGSFGGGPQI
jgi:hypothetical protein